MNKITTLIVLVLVTLFVKSQNCSDLRVILTQNSFTEVNLSTNYDSLVNSSTNITPSGTSTDPVYDWRAYPPGNHNWSGNSHTWQSTIDNPTYSVTFNDHYLFFILSLSMGDTATSPNPVNICMLPFCIARDSTNPSFWNLSMLNSVSNGISNFESKNRTLLKVYNLAGQIVDPKEVNQEIVIYKYTDGSTEKKFINK